MNQKNFIVKSNALIDARYRLSLQESHIILWLLSQITLDDEDFKTHKLNVSQFSQIIGLNPNGQYIKLQEITGSLMRRILKIYNAERQETLQVAWLSSATYQEKKGIILLRFDPGLKPYLLQLKSHFTKIGMTDLLELRSIHSMRIFELLCQCEILGRRMMTIEDIKLWCGVEKNQYKLYAHLKSKIINRAKIEICTKTNYQVDYKEIKESRKVVAIEWTIKKKNLEQEARTQRIKTLDKELKSDSILIESMHDYGYSKMMARRLLKEHGEEVLKNAIKSTDLYIERHHPRNPKAILWTAITDQWKPDVFKVKTRAKQSLK